MSRKGACLIAKGPERAHTGGHNLGRLWFGKRYEKPRAECEDLRHSRD